MYNFCLGFLLALRSLNNLLFFKREICPDCLKFCLGFKLNHDSALTRAFHCRFVS